jgi:dTDP-4-dehydrorhamnose 3,5-epimerase
MRFKRTAIPDVLIVEAELHGDHRGFFMETYRKNLFFDNGIPYEFVQDNHSGSAQGILRGLHYQIKHPQGKLVRAGRGELFDVAVDIRRSSPTFGQWVGAILSAENRKQLWVPPGFAHGFYVLSEWAELIYKATDYYAPTWDRSLQWDDPHLNITWPLINGEQPILSEKDRLAPLLEDADLFD